MLTYRWQDVTFETVQIPGEEYQTLVAVHQPSGQSVSVPIISRRQTIPLIADTGRFWHLENQAKDEAYNRLGKMINTCATPLGKDKIYLCQREPNHNGVHAHCFLSNLDPILYQKDDPTQFATGHCHICFVQLTDDNRGTGLASALYCRDHLDEGRAPTLKHNSCKKCGHDGMNPSHDIRNYSMMWHDGDVHCGKCGAHVRSWDAG
jgi:hypothetical protein